MGEVVTLLTSEDKNEIKAAIKDIIIEQVKNECEEYCSSEYLFDTNLLVELCNDLMEEVRDEVRDILKDKIMKEMEVKLGL